MIAPHDFASYTSSVCGGMLVLGSIILLYKGVITLSQKSSKEAVSIEFKNHLRMTSHYPAIGLFMMGWMFLILPLMIPVLFGDKGPTSVTVRGHLQVNPPDDIQNLSVRLLGGPWDLSINTDGTLEDALYPTLERMRLEISGPGRPALARTVTVDKEGVIFLGPLRVPDPLMDFSNLRRAPVVGSIPARLPNLED